MLPMTSAVESLSPAFDADTGELPSLHKVNASRTSTEFRLYWTNPGKFGVTAPIHATNVNLLELIANITPSQSPFIFSNTCVLHTAVS